MANRFWTCVAAVLVVVTLVQGAPSLGPDLDTCTEILYSAFRIPVNCCLPESEKPLRDFEFPVNLPMRVRRPLHKLDEFRMKQLERGIALMKALPNDDPRSWYQQNQLHCSYTTGVYQQIGGPKEGERHARVIVHGCWFFFPFHAWYVYFVERIIAKLVQDDTFALPYWAWDVFDSDKIPPAFTNESSSLWDSKRIEHSPSSIVDLVAYYDFKNHDHEFANIEEQMKSNTYQMQRSCDAALPPEVFFGGSYRAGDDAKMAGGSMEIGPHLAIHYWLVDIINMVGEDMGQTYVAARDPLFNMHHSQIDRLWRFWLSRGGKNLDDPDYLNAQFFFFDENAEFVRVNVSGALDAEKMRISYEEVEKEWLQNNPQVTSIRARGDVKYPPVGMWSKAWRSLAETITARVVGKSLTETKANVNLFCNGAVSTASIPRPSEGILRTLADSLGEFDEVLVVRGVVTKPFHLIAFLRIFIELPEADSSTPQDCLESMGQIYIAPSGKLGDETVVDQKFEYKTGMGKKLRTLGDNYLRSLRITFVSNWDPNYDDDVSVNFTDIKMEVHKLK